MERYCDIKPFSCKICDKYFFQVNEVEEHIKIHNSISQFKDLKEQVKSLKAQVEELEMKVKHSQIKLVSNTRQKNELKKVAKMETNHELPESRADQEGVNNILKPRKDLNQIMKKTNNAKSTDKENKSQTKDQKLQCKLCDKHFASKRNLKNHINMVHEGKKPFRCKMCGNNFATSLVLKRHINTVHDKKKPFKCNFCPKHFGRKDNLKTHKKFCEKEV